MRAKIKIITGVMGTHAFGINDKGWEVLRKASNYENPRMGGYWGGTINLLKKIWKTDGSSLVYNSMDKRFYKKYNFKGA